MRTLLYAIAGFVIGTTAGCPLGMLLSGAPDGSERELADGGAGSLYCAFLGIVTGLVLALRARDRRAQQRVRDEDR
jgi:hypothetical protein